MKWIASARSSCLLKLSFHPCIIYYIILMRILKLHNISREIKSRRLNWAGHVAIMKEGKNDFKMLTGRPLETLDVHERTISQRFLKKLIPV